MATQVITFEEVLAEFAADAQWEHPYHAAADENSGFVQFTEYRLPPRHIITLISRMRDHGFFCISMSSDNRFLFLTDKY